MKNLLIVCAALLAGCGAGGSSDKGAQASTASFPLKAGLTARVASGATETFNVSGTCTGSATFTRSAATASTFEGKASLETVQSVEVEFADCTPASNSASGTDHVDANLVPLGASVPDVEYSVLLKVPAPLPTSVKVGDAGEYATLATYTDSSKAVATGQRVFSFVVEADTANTAIVNLTMKSYDAATQLLFTQQSRHRIAADGSLTLVSIDVQFSTTSGNHQLYTRA
jgi:hypothetical protein